MPVPIMLVKTNCILGNLEFWIFNLKSRNGRTIEPVFWHASVSEPDTKARLRAKRKILSKALSATAVFNGVSALFPSWSGGSVRLLCRLTTHSGYSSYRPSGLKVPLAKGSQVDTQPLALLNDHLSTFFCFFEFDISFKTNYTQHKYGWLCH